MLRDAQSYRRGASRCWCMLPGLTLIVLIVLALNAGGARPARLLDPALARRSRLGAA